MATKISQLPLVVTPQLTDTLPVVQDGVTKQVSISQILSLGAAQSFGSFTPTFSFGGLAVGMSLTASGFYLKTGKQVDVLANFILSAKGSSTGNAEVGNFPFIGTVVSGAQKWMQVYLQNCAATGATYTTFAALMASGDDSAALYNFPQNNLTAIQLDHTNFTNTSIITLTGTYWTD